mmetsp:Transcript_28345/g.48200  ORF Transcript_28345/g.48200 Transcript_28345/m.48200 type:complete len:299 (-) Transcript_28345:996-1892(-)
MIVRSMNSPIYTRHPQRNLEAFPPSQQGAASSSFRSSSDQPRLRPAFFYHKKGFLSNPSIAELADHLVRRELSRESPHPRQSPLVIRLALRTARVDRHRDEVPPIRRIPHRALHALIRRLSAQNQLLHPQILQHVLQIGALEDAARRFREAHVLPFRGFHPRNEGGGPRRRRQIRQQCAAQFVIQGCVAGVVREGLAVREDALGPGNCRRRRRRPCSPLFFSCQQLGAIRSHLPQQPARVLDHVHEGRFGVLDVGAVGVDGRQLLLDVHDQQRREAGAEGDFVAVRVDAGTDEGVDRW